MIVRPSVIIAANSEPCPGWIDAMTAAGPLSLMVSTGVLRYGVGENNVRADVVPVDFVSNLIIVGSATYAGKNMISVIHAGTTHINPITWYKFCQFTLDYVRT